MCDKFFKDLPLEMIILLDALAADPGTFLSCIPKDIVNYIKPYLYSLKMTTQSTILTVNISMPLDFKIYKSSFKHADFYSVRSVCSELDTIILKTRDHSIKIRNIDDSSKILVTGKAANTENYYLKLINQIFGTKFPGITVISEKTMMQNCVVDICHKVDIEKVRDNIDSVISKNIICPPKVQKRGAKKIVENPRISMGAVWIETIHGVLTAFKSGKVLLSGRNIDDLKILLTILESIIIISMKYS